MIWHQLLAMLSEPVFWACVGVACVGWYAGSCLFARAYLNRGDEPLQAARRAPWSSLALVLVLTVLVAWFVRKDLLFTGLLSLVVLVIPSLVTWMLVSMDTSPQT